MRNEATILAVSAISLIIGAALEELLPKWCGVGFPFLLALSILVSLKDSLPLAVIYAMSAAAFEDSLSALPYFTSLMFFLGSAAMARWTRLGLGTMLVAYPLYNIWLGMWLPGMAGSLFVRFMVAIPLGIFTSFAAGAGFLLLERKAALE